jgi:hypothetical protein
MIRHAFEIVALAGTPLGCLGADTPYTASISVRARRWKGCRNSVRYR